MDRGAPAPHRALNSGCRLNNLLRWAAADKEGNAETQRRRAETGEFDRDFSGSVEAVVAELF
ncbi:MAG: hypothetical protein DRQ58_10145 [Gammaproteobacteria bacterium]|nr:MAG: hypothetical protein DRQ58_10145 [Gammaproteobacteria bacterium]